MLNVLVVDDEEPMLNSYAFMLADEPLGFRLAGKARDGYEAIKAIYELKPDIVFMDINMPGIDGLDTIAQVHDKFPDTVFVLCTAYERFDLARRAIPLGVFAYLVKPVTRADFNGILADIAASQVKRRDARAAEWAAVRDDGLIRRFLTEAVWRGLDADAWRTWRSRLGLSSDRGRIAFLCLDNAADGASDNAVDGAAPVDPERPYAGVNRRLERRHRFVFTVHLGLGMYYFSGEADRDALAADLAAAFGGGDRAADSGVLAGFGSVRSGDELQLSCGEALDDLNRRRNRADLRLRERLLIAQLRRKLGLCEPEEAMALFTAFAEQVFAAHDFGTARTKLAALFVLLLDDCTGCYQAQGEAVPPFDPAEEIAGLPDPAAWREWSPAAFSRVQQLAHVRRTGQFPAPLVKALAFIETNFDRPLQLPDAAAAAGVSPAYLSRLFGAHLGTSFVDHLTVLRVERAERLIREKRLSIKETAAAVGCPDPNYFSKVFRKVVGVSPSSYARGEIHGI